MTAPPDGHPSLADAEPTVYWLEDDQRPDPQPRLSDTLQADLTVVGGGYTGLWAALLAKEREPDLDVVLLDAGLCGDQASGRNGGFAAASLTHGYGNGVARWPEEMTELDRLGRENLRGIAETVDRHAIDCNWEETGELSVATAPHEAEELAELAAELTRAGHHVELLDTAGVRAELDSPTYVAGLLEPDTTALVEPARLAWGLRRACLELGVRIHEHTPVERLQRGDRSMVLTTARGSVDSSRVVLGTNAFPSLLRRRG